MSHCFYHEYFFTFKVILVERGPVALGEKLRGFLETVGFQLHRKLKIDDLYVKKTLTLVPPFKGLSLLD